MEDIWYTVNEEQTTPLFALSSHVLVPILEQLAGEPISRFQITIDPTKQGRRGWNALILIPTFTIVTDSGRILERSVCIKHFLRAEVTEAPCYSYLRAQHFPLPELYGVVRGAQGEEILFLEYLDRLGNIDEERVEDRLVQLSLWARLQTIPITPEFAAFLEPPEGSMLEVWTRLWKRPEAFLEAVERSLQRTWECAQRGELGPELQTLCVDTGDIARLLALATSVVERIKDMPLALIAPEMGVGRRPGTDEVAAFDWHSLYVGPRLSVLQHVLGTPEGVRNGWGRLWSPPRFYAAHYVQELARCGGPVLAEDEVLDEARQLWLANQFIQDWWVDRSRNGDTFVTTQPSIEASISELEREETRQGCRADLVSIFGVLLRFCYIA